MMLTKLEYPWSCTLTGTNKVYNWDPANLEEVKPSRLMIKTAFLMPTAKKDEVTVVQIKTKGYDKQMVSLT